MSTTISKPVRNLAVRNVERQSVDEIEQLLLHADCLAGLYYPTSADDQNMKVENRTADTPLPVPPEPFWHWYGKTEADYLQSGQAQAAKFKSAAQAHGVAFAPGTRVLDFGCSGGRMIRWFVDDARNGVDVWGCDIDAAAIDWCQKNMSPPLNFFSNTTSPHLPVPDGFFDFIYAGSVFTHIKDMSTSWLLELARCTAPGGVVVCTITDEHSLEGMKNLAAERGAEAPRGAHYILENGITAEFLRERGYVSRESSPWWIGIFYSSEFFVRRAEMAFDLIDLVPNFFGFQTGVVLTPRLRR